jgi:hypothetical protein
MIDTDEAAFATLRTEKADRDAKPLAFANSDY